MVKVLLIVLMLAGTCFGSHIVKNSSVVIDTITRYEARNIFLQRQRFLGHTRLTVFVLPMHLPETRNFIENILGMTVSQYKHYVYGATTAGKESIFTVINSSPEMIDRVAVTPGGIGFLSDSWAVYCDGVTTKIMRVE